MRDFTSAIREAMDKKNITVAKIAKETGYSWQYIKDLLKQKRRWNEETMTKVSQVVGVEIHYRLQPTGTDN